MAREYAKTNLTIWQDPEWRALPWPAQHVYKMFWEHPGLSYCGVVDWRPAKMLGWGAGWEREHFDALTDCLRARHFLVVDEDTEECLIRSWVRFDGVMRQPRLAVSLSNAFSEVGSNDIRAVIVDELHKLKEREPEAGGWAKKQVQNLLTLPHVSAKSLDVPSDPFRSGFAIGLGSVSSEVSPAFGPNGTSGLGTGLGTAYNSTSNSTSTTAPARGGASADASAPHGASADAERESTSIEADFAEWYAEYPRKRAKGQAVKAYRAARKKVDAQTLLDGLRRHLPDLTQRPPDKIPYPATWLNGEAWDDEPDTTPIAAPSPAYLQPHEVISAPPGMTDEEYDEWWATHYGNRGTA